MTELRLSDLNYKERKYKGQIFYEVSPEDSLKIINSGEGSNRYTPLGWFLTKDGEVYVAIDNDGGHAWTEEFYSKNVALNWMIFNKYGSVEDAHVIDGRAKGVMDNIRFKRKYSEVQPK